MKRSGRRAVGDGSATMRAATRVNAGQALQTRDAEAGPPSIRGRLPSAGVARGARRFLRGSEGVRDAEGGAVVAPGIERDVGAVRFKGNPDIGREAVELKAAVKRVRAEPVPLVGPGLP